jgi:hypothetical protein
MAFVAIQVHIHQGGIEVLTSDQNKGLVDRRGARNGFASEVSQHVFNHHENQHFILDNENSLTGK